MLPEELVKALEVTVGMAKRNWFIEQAVREKLTQKTVLPALGMTAGVFLSAEDHSEWTTGGTCAAWVRGS